MATPKTNPTSHGIPQVLQHGTVQRNKGHIRVSTNRARQSPGQRRSYLCFAGETAVHIRKLVAGNGHVIQGHQMCKTCTSIPTNALAEYVWQRPSPCSFLRAQTTEGLNKPLEALGTSCRKCSGSHERTRHRRRSWVLGRILFGLCMQRLQLRQAVAPVPFAPSTFRWSRFAPGRGQAGLLDARIFYLVDAWCGTLPLVDAWQFWRARHSGLRQQSAGPNITWIECCCRPSSQRN
mmetsp:Transcript_77573/g.251137  ORF Transcript_77573/g.251137 Transcript_77573/m.251137 type:complete len:235 (-) Transcript_77573:2411-3115(-)